MDEQAIKNSLLIKNQVLADEWHPTKNGRLTPKEVTPGSHKKAWWICSKGHEWEAVIKSRNRGSGCPYCSGRLASKDNNLHVYNPNLAKQWHQNKNGNLTPKDVTANSGQKVWWVCSTGHEWQASIDNRSRGSGCPYCSGQKVCPDNCLHTINPKVASQWHPNRNIQLTPMDVTNSSRKSVWWICEKGHEWTAPIYSRTQGNGCPYCSGRLATEHNNLKMINPALAEKWHPTKNGELTPNDVTPGSTKKVWWLCNREHEWEASVVNRNRGRGCPFCHSQTSQLELRVYAELKHLFGVVDLRKNFDGTECDIYIPSVNIGIEIDGVYYHNKKFQKDIEKTNYLKGKGIIFFRLREQGLERITDDDIFFSRNSKKFSLLQQIIDKILKKTNLSEQIVNDLKNYIKAGELRNNREYMSLLERLPSPLEESSLESTNIILASEWHKDENGSLTPKDVYPNSNMKVWWKCNKGHEWKTNVAHRSNGTGCPYCIGKKVCKDNCLQAINPILANEWHPSKNGNLTPNDVTPGSGKKVWWKCSKGHEWKAQVSHRSNGRGCPYC